MKQLAFALALAAHQMAVAGAQNPSEEFTSALLIPGFVLPMPPVAPLGGGEVILEVVLDDTGQVREVTNLQGVAPWLDPVVDAVERWEFAPAIDWAEPDAGPVATRVLVVGLFRSPMLYDLGSQDTRAEVTGSASQEAPVPKQIVAPRYPPRALFSGTVLVEVAVTPDGIVSEAQVLGGATAFAAATLEAARAWRFRPAEHDSRPVTSYAYLIFGFRQPITESGLATPASPSLPR